MKGLRQKILGYTRIFYWSFIFLGAAVLLYFILPGEQKFKYEYQKGFSWQHENLVAPFDFAIVKSDQELETEKAELLKSIIPYFTFDTLLAYEKVKQLEYDLKISNETQKLALLKISENLKIVYSNGILQRSLENYPELEGKTELKKREGTLVTKIAISKIYSEKTAYNELHNYIIDLKNDFPQLSGWLDNIPVEKYIASNLQFDETTTQREIDHLIQNIPKTRNMVQMGEIIVLGGEIINAEKFQILESLKESFEKNRGDGVSRFWVSIGKIILIVVLLFLVFAFLYSYRRETLNDFRKLLFIVLCITGMVFLAIFFNSFPNLHIYLVPLAISPIVLRTFFDSRTAIFMLIITTLLIGFYAPNNFEFILLQVTAGIVAVLSLNKMHRRVHLVITTFWVLLTYFVVFAALNLIHEGSFATFDYNMIKWFVLSSLLVLLGYPLIFIFEKIFGFVSDVTLIELSDSNQPLLRKLSEEAPGTFQHSLQIANLAEEVILKIGGNPFLVRAGALYHDIGKIAHPNFFIENQAIGMNPHDSMNYLQSAKLIIDHVKNGIKMAKKHKLPESLIEFIATHHGTTKAKYFYLKHMQEFPDEKIDENAFVYQGPLPVSKEASVVMIIDGIEAASRSLKEKTHDNMQELINNMVDEKINDKQLDLSNMTFRDIKIIKETMLNKLLNIYHVRIEYPKENNT
ncbi:MAG: HDIG domain-containing protein [Bacteroidales bacterium]|jgi:putative nucleotidyltransferase with HDIG domain|nr:HDIG domain-containing protein [Bacteroidales bacterium]